MNRKQAFFLHCDLLPYKWIPTTPFMEKMDALMQTAECQVGRGVLYGRLPEHPEGEYRIRATRQSHNGSISFTGDWERTKVGTTLRPEEVEGRGVEWFYYHYPEPTMVPALDLDTKGD